MLRYDTHHFQRLCETSYVYRFHPSQKCGCKLQSVARCGGSMLETIGVTLNILLPIFVVIGVAYVVGRTLKPDPRPLSTLLIYLFVPALILEAVANSQISLNDLLGIGGTVAVFTIIFVVIGRGVARALRLDAGMTAAFVVSLIMVNAANYGLPVNEFAFGTEGLEIAVIYYVMATVIGSNTGIFIASQGRLTPQQALLNVIRVPMFGASVLGVVLNVFNVPIPVTIDRSLALLSSATVPVMLALLGISLSAVRLDTNLRPVLIASALRLVAAPLVALPLAYVFGLTDTVFNVTVIQSSTPSAVLGAAVVLEFGTHSAFVSQVILVSTLLSLITMTILLIALGAA